MIRVLRLTVRVEDQEEALRFYTAGKDLYGNTLVFLQLSQ